MSEGRSEPDESKISILCCKVGVSQTIKDTCIRSKTALSGMQATHVMPSLHEDNPDLSCLLPTVDRSTV